MRISDWSSDVCSSDLVFQRREEAEIDVHRLIIRRLDIAGHMAEQRAQRRFGRQRGERPAQYFRRGKSPGEQPYGRALDIAFAARHLARTADMRRAFQAQRAIQPLGAPDEGVAGKPAESGELRLLPPERKRVV